jgi:RNA polymerase sigma factor (sigma-70 family)
MKRLIKPTPSLESVRARFVTTDWTVVAQAGAAEETEASGTALSQLYQDYWPPVYAFVRKRGHPRAEAQDLTQDFFLYLMERRAYARADAFKGKFRSFLLGWLKKFLLAVHAREGRLKRGGEQTFVFLDAELDALESLGAKELAVNPPPDEERLFEWHWAILLVNRAMKAMETEYAEGIKSEVVRELKPFLQGGPGLPSHVEVAARLNMPVDTLRSHLSRMRSHYRRLLLHEVNRTLAGTVDAEEELGFLYRVLTANSFQLPLG